MSLKEKIDLAALPRHIAVIMDGNGRWARQKGNMRVFGHRNAIKAVRDTTESAAELGVSYLTLFAFSTENWKRPKAEVDALMTLLVETLRKETSTLMDNDVRLNAIGFLDLLTTGFESLVDARMQHGLRSIIAGRFGRCRNKRFKRFAFKPQYNCRVGAKLANAHSDRLNVSFSNLSTALGKSSGQQEDGIGASHFTVERNWIGARTGDVVEGSSATQRTGERYCTHSGMTNKLTAGLVRVALQHGESTSWQSAFLDRFGHNSAEDFTSPWMGRMSLYDHRAARS